jgi:hypothetical protein
MDTFFYLQILFITLLCIILILSVVCLIYYQPGIKCVEDLKDTPLIHVITVGTNREPTKRLLNTIGRFHGYKIHYRGECQSWTGYQLKLRETLQVVKTLHENDIVMHLDAYDTIVLTDAYEVYFKYNRFQKPIIISTEKNLAPNHEFDVIKSKMEEIYPQSPTKFRWINSGTYMGTAGKIKNMLESMGAQFLCRDPFDRIFPYCDDQRCFHSYFLKNQHLIALDYHQDIFYCMWDTKEAKFIKKIRRIVSETGSLPCILHGNGPSPKSYETALKDLGLS